MSSPIGGFSYKVDADVSAAQAAMRRLVQSSQQSAQQIQAAFASAKIGVNAAQVQRATQQVANQVKQLQKDATLTVRVNLNEAEKGLAQIAAQAQAIGNTRLNLRVDVSDTKRGHAALQEMEKALRAAKAGDTINLDVRAASVREGTAALKQLESAARSAAAAGANIRLNVQTSQQGSGFAREVGRGFLQQATPGLATGAGAAVGVVAAQAVTGLADAMVQGAAAGIKYNAMLEDVSVQSTVFLGSAEATAVMLERVREIAEKTPFSFGEIAQAQAKFSNLAGGNIARLERFLVLATQLAAVNPDVSAGGGIEGATRALTEAAQGDFTSITARFPVSPAQARQLKEMGLSVDELFEKLVKLAGGSQKLVDAMGDTFTGRLAKAGEVLDRLVGAATKPLFETLSAGLALFGGTVDKVVGPVERLVAAIQKLPGGQAGLSVVALANPAGLLAAGAVAAPAPRPATGLSAGEQARQDAIAAAQDEAGRLQGAAQQQEGALKKIETQLERNAARARDITQEYNAQLRPLEKQQRDLDRQIAGAEKRGREIDARARAAEGPVETRAQIAAAEVVLDHEQQVMAIRHQRAELSEQIAAAEEAIANRAAEAQIRAAEAALRVARDAAQEQRQARQDSIDELREEVRVRQEARRDALDGLREEIRERQELRQTALDGLRDLITAQQEARRDALEGIQDQIRARREQYDEAREAAQEASRVAKEDYQDEQRLLDRGHQSLMENYRDRIDALRDQLQVRRENTAAERELAAFDAGERERGRQERLQDAGRAIRQARTGSALRDAALGFRRAQQDVAADRKREEIQGRITKEREAEEDRREKIQEKINRLEREAREDDRKFQREKEQREDERREQDRVEQQILREEERAERERRKIEDQQVRQQQREDREADKVAQQTLREAERADREQDKIDQAIIREAEKEDRRIQREEERKIRVEEKAARDADREADRVLREQERGIQAARDALAATQAAQEDSRQQAQLGRLRESSELQDRILTNRQAVLDAIDVTAKAQAAADKIRNDAVLAGLNDRKAKLDEEYREIGRKLAAALAPITKEREQLELSRDAAKAMAEWMTIVATKAAEATETLKLGPLYGPPDPGPLYGPADPNPLLGPPDPGATAASAVAPAGIEALASNISDGLIKWLQADSSTEDAFTTWAGEQVNAFAAVWEVQSPSQVMARMAAEIGAGLVEGLATQHEAANAAMAAYFQAAWEGGAAQIDAIIVEIITRFGGTEDYSLPPQLEATAPTIGASIATTFDQAWAQGGAAGVDAVLTEIGNHWATVGDEIDSPRNRREVERAITDLFGPNVLDRAFRDVERNFEIYGNNMAVAFIDGWTAQMVSWQPYVPAAGTGYSGGAGSTGSGGYSIADDGYSGSSSYGATMQPGPQDIQNYLLSRGWDLGDPGYGLAYRDLANQLAAGYRPPDDMVVTGRRYGGPFDMGRPYLLHQDEIMVPNSAGEVLPPEFLSGVKAMAGRSGAWDGGGSSPQVSINIGSGAVNITGASDIGLDNPALEAFGRRVVEDLVSVLHAAKRHTPGRVNPLLPGAR